MGESYVEEAVGADLLAISGLELGYCARMGEVDLRVIGSAEDRSNRPMPSSGQTGDFIFSTRARDLETVIVQSAGAKKATLAVAESCTGGFLAHRLTNVRAPPAFFWPVT